jgi:hypothetical protein
MCYGETFHHKFILNERERVGGYYFEGSIDIGSKSLRIVNRSDENNLASFVLYGDEVLYSYIQDNDSISLSQQQFNSRRSNFRDAIVLSDKLGSRFLVFKDRSLEVVLVIRQSGDGVLSDVSDS